MGGVKVPEPIANEQSNTHKSKPPVTVEGTHLGITFQTIAIWLILIAAEIVHGIVRGIFLVPHVGEFRSNQIGVFTGSIIILVIAVVCVRWIGATRPAQLLTVGFLWLALTLTFEILFGRFVVGASWERIAADYNVLKGGLCCRSGCWSS
jgi:hypothetical protein